MYRTAKRLRHRARRAGELPPRLPEQPIFYPVTNEAYARHIAKRWNVDENGAGYVTQYWILAEMNRNVVGLIEVIVSFTA